MLGTAGLNGGYNKKNISKSRKKHDIKLNGVAKCKGIWYILLRV